MLINPLSSGRLRKLTDFGVLVDKSADPKVQNCNLPDILGVTRSEEFID